MARDGTDWVLHAPRDGAEMPAWVSAMAVENPIDFEVTNHYIATHPASLFTNWIIASAVTLDGRMNLMNRDFTHLSDGTATKGEVPDRAALRTLLSEHFGFDLPEVETIRVPAIPDWG
jgi:N-hydroxyarylamine O-acetyltransferase